MDDRGQADALRDTPPHPACPFDRLLRQVQIRRSRRPYIPVLKAIQFLGDGALRAHA